VQFLQFLHEDSIVTFMLLFIRLSSLLAFLPIFSAMSIPAAVKGVFALYLAFLFFPITPKIAFDPNSDALIIAIISEATLGFLTGMILSFVFAAFSVAGEVIGMVMGLSMASSFDPQNQQSSQLISAFLNMFLLVLVLATNLHHLMIELIAYSVEKLPLGGFVFTKSIARFTIEGIKHMFFLGFTLSFPFIALSILSDIMFGMIMRSLPSFNLMVIGMPVKTVVGFGVIIATLGSMAYIFKREFTLAIVSLRPLF
jgi:flagellar biosynthesis protein FliR